MGGGAAPPPPGIKSTRIHTHMKQSILKYAFQDNALCVGGWGV